MNRRVEGIRVDIRKIIHDDSLNGGPLTRRDYYKICQKIGLESDIMDSKRKLVYMVAEEMEWDREPWEMTKAPCKSELFLLRERLKE